jgi:predicted ester cyclase
MEVQTIKNKEISRLYWEYIWKHRDLHMTASLMNDKMIYSAPRILVEGKVKILEMMQRYMNAFDESEIVILDQLAEKNKVFTRAKFRGIHSGMLGNLAPTHKKISFEIMNQLEISEGLIVHEWEVYDQLGMMQQLGMELTPKELHVH